MAQTYPVIQGEVDHPCEMYSDRKQLYRSPNVPNFDKLPLPF